MEYVLFYGTLRRGFAVQRELRVEAMLEWVGERTISGVLHDLGPYPAMTLGDGTVVGDLYRVLDPAVFDVLDPYEGYWPHDPAGSWYHRVRVAVAAAPEGAWVYVHNRPLRTGAVVEHGDWVAHRNARPSPCEHF